MPTRRGLGRRSATALVAVGIAVLGAAAAIDAFRDGDPSPPPAAQPAEAVTGPDVPLSDTLAGRLWLTDLFTCELSVIDLASLAVERPGLDAGCGVWPDPRGDLAILPHEAPRERELEHDLALARLGAGPEAESLGVARGEAVWSRDGNRFAWCVSPHETVVRELSSGAESQLPGCDPRFGTGGSVLTRTYGQGIGDVLRDGEVLVSNEALTRGLGFAPSSALVLGYDERPDGLLAIAGWGLLEGRRETILSLWDGGELVRRIPLPTPPVDAMSFFGEAVRFSPDGRRLTVAYRGVGLQLALVDVESGAGLALPLVTGEYVWGYAWSPDGRWLAVSTGRDVRLVPATGGDASHVIPLQAVARAWTA